MQSLVKTEIIQNIYFYIRSTGASDFKIIENPPHSKTDNHIPVLKRNWFGDIDGIYHQVLLWILNEVIRLLCYDGQIFIDLEFRICPANFGQSLHELLLLVEYCWILSVVTVNFEKGLLNAGQLLILFQVSTVHKNDKDSLARRRDQSNPASRADQKRIGV
ncbi:hypothetical protein MXB_4438 [Myxobolus squamalis]|nr:hypothetical protein MXB_4438 [Myxobolus squamalis]